MYSLDGMMDSKPQSDLLNSTNQPAIELLPVSELDSERFQQLWSQLPTGCGGIAIQKSLRLDLSFNIPQIEQLATDNKISTMAHGQLGTELKFFFHCQMGDKSGFFMIETLFNLQSRVMSYTVKSTRPDMETQFNTYFQKVFSSLTIG